MKHAAQSAGISSTRSRKEILSFSVRRYMCRTNRITSNLRRTLILKIQHTKMREMWESTNVLRTIFRTLATPIQRHTLKNEMISIEHRVAILLMNTYNVGQYTHVYEPPSHENRDEQKSTKLQFCRHSHDHVWIFQAHPNSTCFGLWTTSWFESCCCFNVIIFS